MHRIAFAYQELHALLGDLVAACLTTHESDALAAARHYLRRHCCTCGDLLADSPTETPLCEVCRRWPFGFPNGEQGLPSTDDSAPEDELPF